MSSLSVYAYYNAAGVQRYVDDNDFIHTGTWSAFGSYVADRDSAIYGNSQYLAIITNVGASPLAPVTRNNPRKWSPLVALYEYQSGSTVGPNIDQVARDMAAAAYYLAQIGTNLGTAAYDLAISGSNLATSGSNLAWQAYLLALSGASGTLVNDALNIANSAFTIAVAGTTAAAAAQSEANAAYQLAQIGTNVGTNALTAAGIAQSTANGAYALAVIGTNAAAGAQSTANSAYLLAQNGTSAYNIAVAGTNAAAAAQTTANAAYQLAQIGTNVGTNALAAAAAAGSTAVAAYNLAVVGTGAASAANATATAAYNLATTGTSVGSAAQVIATAAYNLAALGTLIPPLSTLPDVSLPSPAAQQVLMFNGSVWVAATASSAASAPIGFTFYLDDTNSGTLGYDSLSTVPTGGPEVADSITVTSGEGLKPLPHAYLSTVLNRTVIDAGIWEFNSYVTALPSTGTTVTNLVTKIYRLSNAGTETLLFTATSADIGPGTPELLSDITVQGTFPAVLSDKILAKYFAQTTDTGTVSLTLYHNGTAHYSHFHTPLASLHDDLAGLHGGTTGQYYHVTIPQNDALVGDVGTPSATNPYVTAQSILAERGTRSAQDQFLQNQITANTTAFASPSALVGLIVVNGSGTSAMRSDAAPRLDQSIAPTWSGYHKFTKGFAVPTLAAVTLTAPATYLFTDQRGAITLDSTGSTPASREFALAAGTSEGQELTLVWTGTGAGEMLNNAVYSGCHVRLQSDWQPTNYSTMLLRFNGVDWLEISRNGTDGYALAVANEALQIAIAGTNAVVTEQGTRSSQDQNLQNQIIYEAGTRSDADTALYLMIVAIGSGTFTDLAEAGTRAQADQVLQNQITQVNQSIVTEQGTRSSQDQNLQNQITQNGLDIISEMGTRSSADQNLQNQISAISTTGTVVVTNIGTGAGLIYSQTSGGTIQLKTITAGANVQVVNGVSDIIISATASGTSSGANAVANEGGGTGLIYDQTSNGTILLRTLTQGANITITTGGTEITIAATSGGAGLDILQVQVFS